MLRMSYAMKQKIIMSTPSMLGNYFSNRSHAVKEDLDSFKAFLMLLKYQYRDRVEIPRTVTKLLHMYHPQDGYEAYMKLVKVICVLLEELDRDILKYLLSIIPPPNTQDKKSMEEEVRQVAGFTLLSTPAFHTWVLPVLNNTPSGSQQQSAADMKSVNMVEISKPQDDYQADTKSIEVAEIPQMTENQNSLNSDNDSIIAEPKLEDYELYEIVGDLSKTILNQISTKTNSKKSTHNNVKEMFDLESLMLPSAMRMSNEIVNPSDCNKEEQKAQINGLAQEEKKPLSACDLTVDPALQKSVKNFIARACGLLPSTPSGNLKSKKQTKRKSESKVKIKKNTDNGTKVKDIKTTPKRRRSLLDELICPQKKPLLSYLITPLDPMTDSVDPIWETSNAVSTLPTLTRQDVDTKKCVNNGTESYVRSEPDIIYDKKPDIENRTEIKKSVADKKKKKKTANKKSSKNDSKKSKCDASEAICDMEYSMNEAPSCSKKKENLTETPTLSAILPSVPDLAPASEEEQHTLEFVNDFSVTTQEAVAFALEDGTPIDSEVKGVIQTNEGDKKTEENILTETSSYGMKQECDTDPIIMDLPCKNLDLEWNRENMKLFGINMRGETCHTCVSGSNVNLADNNDKIDESVSTLQNSETLTYESSVPFAHGFSTYKSHTSAEYLSYLHELAVTKCSEQKGGPLFPSTSSNSKEPLPPSENNKLPCTESKESIPESIPCYQNEGLRAPTSLPQQFGSHEHAPELSSSQAVNLSANMNRIWTEYSGGFFDPQHPLNLQRRRCLSLNLQTDPTSLRQYDCMRNMQLGASLPSVSQSSDTNMIGSSSIACNISSSYESMADYQPLPNNQHWMMKPSGSMQQVQQPPWGGFPAYGQYSAYRELAQQRARFAQRAAFLQQASPSVNNYLDPAHTLMMHGLWGSCGSMRHGLYARTNEPSTMLPCPPHSSYPIKDPTRQRLRAMTPGLFPNYAGPVPATNSSTIQPQQTKRRKLEEIVGRLKEAEKIT